METKVKIEVGKWYLDGFCTNHIITPVEDNKYIGGIRWVTVKKCVSREIAEIRIKHHNKVGLTGTGR